MQCFFLLGLLPLLATAVPSPTELGLEKRSITCLKVGATATASWTNSAGKSCKWTGVVGSNFGTNSVNDGEYVALKLSTFGRATRAKRLTFSATATLAMAAVALVAPVQPWAMSIPRTASLTISARGSTTRVEVLGESVVLE